MSNIYIYIYFIHIYLLYLSMRVPVAQRPLRNKTGAVWCVLWCDCANGCFGWLSIFGWLLILSVDFSYLRYSRRVSQWMCDPYCWRLTKMLNFVFNAGQQSSLQGMAKPWSVVQWAVRPKAAEVADNNIEVCFRDWFSVLEVFEWLQFPYFSDGYVYGVGHWRHTQFAQNVRLESRLSCGHFCGHFYFTFV